MLRALVIVLVLTNLLFFGWIRGWFAPGMPAPAHGEREPARLAAQVLAERVKVTPTTPAAPGTACLEAGPYDEAGITAAEAALAQAGLPPGSWIRVAAAEPGQQRLRAPAADADQRARLLALRATALAGGFAACVKAP